MKKGLVVESLKEIVKKTTQGRRSLSKNISISGEMRFTRVVQNYKTEYTDVDKEDINSDMFGTRLPCPPYVNIIT